MAFTPDLESHTKCRQNNSTVDSLALEIAALLPRLKQYALRLTHNPAVADDLVQETIVRGIENIHLWRQGTDFASMAVHHPAQPACERCPPGVAASQFGRIDLCRTIRRMFPAPSRTAGVARP